MKAESSEYAITSEGIYEIMYPNSEKEQWNKRTDLLTVDASNDQKVEEIIESGLSDLKNIWNDIRVFRKNHMDHEMTFLNEGGELSLLEDKDGKISRYEFKTHVMHIEGDMKLNIPSGMELKPSEGCIKYISEQDDALNQMPPQV